MLEKLYRFAAWLMGRTIYIVPNRGAFLRGWYRSQFRSEPPDGKVTFIYPLDLEGGNE